LGSISLYHVRVIFNYLSEKLNMKENVTKSEDDIEKLLISLTAIFINDKTKQDKEKSFLI